jgi:putative FmdB family regulatory protein
MPIYEYRCADCRRVTSILVRGFTAPTNLTCPRCSSTKMRKLVSRFAVMKSEESRLDDLADPSNFGDLDENDPKSVARWARRMGQEMGEDLGDEFDEAIEQMEAGELPPEGESESPDLGGGADL